MASKTKPMTTHAIDLSPISNSGVDLEQYFGLWAVDDSNFLTLFDRVSQMNLAAHVTINKEPQPQPQTRAPINKPATTRASIGIIDIRGTLTKRGSSLSSASSLISLRSAVRAAAKDDEIDAIMLRIDSPGGTVAGTQDLADEVHNARQTKPVFAFAEDLAASAAYWIGSQAERFYVNSPTALIGSIGTFVGLYDYSQMAEKKGIRAVAIKAGELKGSGFPGAEITEDQVAYWQELVDKTQSQFTSGIARGRDVTEKVITESWVTGRVYMAADAVNMGLVDEIRTFEQAITDLANRVVNNPEHRRTDMSTDQQMAVDETPKAAELSELKATCPGADSDFLLSQVEAKATTSQAQTAWIAEQDKQIKAFREETEAAKKDSGTAGVDTVGGKVSADEDSADVIADFDTKIQTKINTGMARHLAVRKVDRENPGLREAYVAARNANRV